VDGDAAARRAAQALLDLGARRVILTLGAAGALFADADAIDAAPAFRVSARDTTGAGDAFIGSYSAFWCEGITPREAARRASLYAALSVAAVGAQKSFPDRETFDAAWRARGG